MAGGGVDGSVDARREEGGRLTCREEAARGFGLIMRPGALDHEHMTLPLATS